MLKISSQIEYLSTDRSLNDIDFCDNLLASMQKITPTIKSIKKPKMIISVKWFSDIKTLKWLSNIKKTNPHISKCIRAAKKLEKNLFNMFVLFELKILLHPFIHIDLYVN